MGIEFQSLDLVNAPYCKWVGLWIGCQQPKEHGNSELQGEEQTEGRTDQAGEEQRELKLGERRQLMG